MLNQRNNALLIWTAAGPPALIAIFVSLAYLYTKFSDGLPHAQIDGFKSLWFIVLGVSVITGMVTLWLLLAHTRRMKWIAVSVYAVVSTIVLCAIQLQIACRLDNCL